MRAKDVMTTQVITVRPDVPVEQAARLMMEHHVSGLPVVDTGGAVIGMISEGDLLRRREIGTESKQAWWLRLLTTPREHARDFLHEHAGTVADVMTKGVATASEDMPLADIAEVLEERHIKRLPVVDKAGKIVGIVSRANLLRALASQRKEGPAAPTADDRNLRQAVFDALDGRNWATYGPVNVIVTDGVVDLWGFVESKEERQAMLTAAGEVPGVKKVIDHFAFVQPWVHGL